MWHVCLQLSVMLRGDAKYDCLPQTNGSFLQFKSLRVNWNQFLWGSSMWARLHLLHIHIWISVSSATPPPPISTCGGEVLEKKLTGTHYMDGPERWRIINNQLAISSFAVYVCDYMDNIVYFALIFPHEFWSRRAGTHTLLLKRYIPTCMAISASNNSAFVALLQKFACRLIFTLGHTHTAQTCRQHIRCQHKLFVIPSAITASALRPHAPTYAPSSYLLKVSKHWPIFL